MALVSAAASKASSSTALRAPTTDTGGHEAGFRVTQQTVDRDTGDTVQSCHIVMWVINHHNAVVPDGDLPEGWTSTQLPDGTYRTEGTTVGDC
ncbi:MAG: hypothetical protein OXH86_12750 [Acidimicrobiaceae bacterium]|nr:hypothetical protein [Acidimicrobiaceae bacterium]